jgi:septum formation protein
VIDRGRGATALVLASGSPRRRALLEQLGLTFRVEVPAVDESTLAAETPPAYVARVAEAKARTVRAEGPAVVVAADTTVDLDGTALGKPATPQAARDLLGRLSGRTHLVHTGVAVALVGDPLADVDLDLDLDPDADAVVVEVATTAVTFRPLAPMWVDWYVGTDEPYDKAGGYAVQGAAGLFVARVDGSPTNVIGLPLDVLARLVEKVGHDLLDFRT